MTRSPPTLAADDHPPPPIPATPAPDIPMTPLPQTPMPDSPGKEDVQGEDDGINGERGVSVDRRRPARATREARHEDHQPTKEASVEKKASDKGNAEEHGGKENAAEGNKTEGVKTRSRRREENAQISAMEKSDIGKSKTNEKSPEDENQPVDDETSAKPDSSRTGDDDDASKPDETDHTGASGTLASWTASFPAEKELAPENASSKEKKPSSSDHAKATENDNQTNVQDDVEPLKSKQPVTTDETPVDEQATINEDDVSSLEKPTIDPEATLDESLSVMQDKPDVVQKERAEKAAASDPTISTDEAVIKNVPVKVTQASEERTVLADPGPAPEIINPVKQGRDADERESEQDGDLVMKPVEADAETSNANAGNASGKAVQVAPEKDASYTGASNEQNGKIAVADQDENTADDILMFPASEQQMLEDKDDTSEGDEIVPEVRAQKIKSEEGADDVDVMDPDADPSPEEAEPDADDEDEDEITPRRPTTRSQAPLTAVRRRTRSQAISPRRLRRRSEPARPKPPPPKPKKKPVRRPDLGDRLSVLWHVDDVYYTGTVDHVLNFKGRRYYDVTYDSLEREYYLDLKVRKWRFLDDPDADEDALQKEREEHREMEEEEMSKDDFPKAGDKVMIMWHVDRKYYPGMVKDVLEVGKKLFHDVIYDKGDVEFFLDLRVRKWYYAGQSSRRDSQKGGGKSTPKKRTPSKGKKQSTLTTTPAPQAPVSRRRSRRLRSASSDSSPQPPPDASRRKERAKAASEDDWGSINFSLPASPDFEDYPEAPLSPPSPRMMPSPPSPLSPKSPIDTKVERVRSDDEPADDEMSALELRADAAASSHPKTAERRKRTRPVDINAIAAGLVERKRQRVESMQALHGTAEDPSGSKENEKPKETAPTMKDLQMAEEASASLQVDATPSEKEADKAKLTEAVEGPRAPSEDVKEKESAMPGEKDTTKDAGAQAETPTDAAREEGPATLSAPLQAAAMEPDTVPITQTEGKSEPLPLQQSQTDPGPVEETLLIRGPVRFKGTPGQNPNATLMDRRQLPEIPNNEELAKVDLSSKTQTKASIETPVKKSSEGHAVERIRHIGQVPNREVPDLEEEKPVEPEASKMRVSDIVSVAGAVARQWAEAEAADIMECLDDLDRKIASVGRGQEATKKLFRMKEMELKKAERRRLALAQDKVTTVEVAQHFNLDECLGDLKKDFVGLISRFRDAVEEREKGLKRQFESIRQQTRTQSKKIQKVMDYIGENSRGRHAEKFEEVASKMRPVAPHILSSTSHGKAVATETRRRSLPASARRIRGSDDQADVLEVKLQQANAQSDFLAKEVRRLQAVEKKLRLQMVGKNSLQERSIAELTREKYGLDIPSQPMDVNGEQPYNTSLEEEVQPTARKATAPSSRAKTAQPSPANRRTASKAIKNRSQSARASRATPSKPTGITKKPTHARGAAQRVPSQRTASRQSGRAGRKSLPSSDSKYKPPAPMSTALKGSSAKGKEIARRSRTQTTKKASSASKPAPKKVLVVEAAIPSVAEQDKLNKNFPKQLGKQMDKQAGDLLALVMIVWLLQDEGRTEPPPREDVVRQRLWVKNCVKSALRHCYSYLNTCSGIMSAKKRLLAEVESQSIETQWILDSSEKNLEKARENYKVWEPALKDAEWQVEKWVLRTITHVVCSAMRLTTAGRFSATIMYAKEIARRGLADFDSILPSHVPDPSEAEVLPPSASSSKGGLANVDRDSVTGQFVSKQTGDATLAPSSQVSIPVAMAVSNAATLTATPTTLQSRSGPPGPVAGTVKSGLPSAHGNQKDQSATKLAKGGAAVSIQPAGSEAQTPAKNLPSVNPGVTQGKDGSTPASTITKLKGSTPSIAPTSNGASKTHTGTGTVDRGKTKKSSGSVAGAPIEGAVAHAGVTAGPSKGAPTKGSSRAAQTLKKAAGQTLKDRKTGLGSTSKEGSEMIDLASVPALNAIEHIPAYDQASATSKFGGDNGVAQPHASANSSSSVGKIPSTTQQAMVGVTTPISNPNKTQSAANTRPTTQAPALANRVDSQIPQAKEMEPKKLTKPTRGGSQSSAGTKSNSDVTKRPKKSKSQGGSQRSSKKTPQKEAQKASATRTKEMAQAKPVSNPHPSARGAEPATMLPAVSPPAHTSHVLSRNMQAAMKAPVMKMSQIGMPAPFSPFVGLKTPTTAQKAPVEALKNRVYRTKGSSSNLQVSSGAQTGLTRTTHMDTVGPELGGQAEIPAVTYPSRPAVKSMAPKGLSAQEFSYKSVTGAGNASGVRRSSTASVHPTVVGADNQGLVSRLQNSMQQGGTRKQVGFKSITGPPRRVSGGAAGHGNVQMQSRTGGQELGSSAHDVGRQSGGGPQDASASLVNLAADAYERSKDSEQNQSANVFTNDGNYSELIGNPTPTSSFPSLDLLAEGVGLKRLGGEERESLPATPSDLLGERQFGIMSPMNFERNNYGNSVDPFSSGAPAGGSGRGGYANNGNTGYHQGMAGGSSGNLGNLMNPQQSQLQGSQQHLYGQQAHQQQQQQQQQQGRQDNASNASGGVAGYQHMRGSGHHLRGSYQGGQR